MTKHFCDVCGKENERLRPLSIGDLHLTSYNIGEFCDGCIQRVEIFVDDLKNKVHAVRKNPKS